MLDMPANYDFVQEPETARCVVSAAARYHLPPEALLVVLFQEGGKDGTVATNKDGSQDLGPAQINTVHLDDRSPFKGYITRHKLLTSRCTNIHTAAWIIGSFYIKERDIWQAIGRYHAPYNKRLARVYKLKVSGRLPYARHTLAKNQSYQYYIRLYYGAPAGPYAQR